MKYRVIRPCWWQERLWAAGEEAEIHPAEAPPRHFEPVYEEAPAPQAVVPATKRAAKAKSKKPGRPARPTLPNPKGA